MGWVDMIEGKGRENGGLGWVIGSSKAVLKPIGLSIFVFVLSGFP